MPRLVRRRPLGERIKAYLNPLDVLLWLSEELDSSDWDQWQKDWATSIGVGLNFVFLIARANSGPSTRRGDDVFGDDEGYSWWSWLVCTFVLLELLICLPVVGIIRCFCTSTPLLPQRLLHLLPPAAL